MAVGIQIFTYGNTVIFGYISFHVRGKRMITATDSFAQKSRNKPLFSQQDFEFLQYKTYMDFRFDKSCAFLTNIKSEDDNDDDDDEALLSFATFDSFQIDYLSWI